MNFLEGKKTIIAGLVLIVGAFVTLWLRIVPPTDPLFKTLIEYGALLIGFRAALAANPPKP